MSVVEAEAIISVILDQAIHKPLDYQVPSSIVNQVQPGMRVLVPLKGALSRGTVFAFKEKADFFPVRPIHSLLSEKALLTKDLIALAHWISEYYGASLYQVLRCMLPSSVRKQMEPKTQFFIQSLHSQNQLRTTCEQLRLSQPSQARVLDVLLKYPKGIFLSELLEQTDVSRSPIQTLIKNKILQTQKVRVDRFPLLDQEYFLSPAKKLNPEQEESLGKICQSIDQNTFAVHLIHGVTGSGKTEVYLQAIDHALKQNKKVIFLVPEISLTSQTIERLKSRFSCSIAILHHRVSIGERLDAWHKMREGTTPIVLGARSALFSPLDDLGLIIVDEEHESSYKQSEESPRYHARDVAVMRAKLCNCPIILGTATPSLESYYNAMTGKYHLSTLHARADQATLPKITLIDMKREKEKSQGFTLFSSDLLKAIEKRLTVGEQILLFLNRRGYHTSSLCRSCGLILKCSACDLSLTYHLGEDILACHLCDFRLKPPRICPQCKNEEEFKYKGVGTELLQKSLHAIFPQVRSLRMDADTTRHKGSLQQIFKQFRSGKADVLIGTQMIAKGLHFPSVTLVGVLNADSGLQIPDFRASEHTFQLIVQVAGRSGRGSMSGEVMIQTFMPEHELIQLASEQDFKKFYSHEIELRKLFQYPPFTHLVKCAFSGKILEELDKHANRFRDLLIQKLSNAFEIHPLVASGHAKVKGMHRMQFLLKGMKVRPILKAIKEVQASQDLQKQGIHFALDVDPISTFF